MKKAILMMAFAIATVSVVSCDKKAKTESTTEHEGHDHKAGDAHQLAYVCPMDCEKGKTYETAGKCPVCKMDLVNENLKKQTKSTEEEEHGHSHGEEGHGH